MDPDALIGATLLSCVTVTMFLVFHKHTFRTLWLFFAPAVDRDFRPFKQRLLPKLSGHVVEIGSGFGTNLDYLDPDRVTELTLVEPNTAMHGDIAHKAESLGFQRVRIFSCGAESIPVADGAADHVMSTMVLCSVSSVPAVLREVRRILKRGGTFAFVEHVGDVKGTWRRSLQQLLKVPWGVVTDGCNLHRDTLDAIKDLPWRVKGKVVSDAVGMWITRPTAVGTATKT